MFTHKDLSSRTIFILNGIEHTRRLRVCAGELLLEEEIGDTATTLTKFPFQKILILFVIGHISITTPLIEKCKQHGIALVVVKPNLRPVFIWASSAEANYLLRKKQYDFPPEDISIAKIIVSNKIQNQIRLLKKSRRTDIRTIEAIEYCTAAISTIEAIDEYEHLMGLEGRTAKHFFSAYYQGLNWRGRHPRAKCDELNLTLDIGYTILFNFMECFLRMYGFDIYIGVYHRLWFKRKSLVCDLIEPFRCIIDHATIRAFRLGQFQKKDFVISKHEYRLRSEKSMEYYKIFYDALISHKMEFFKYVQQYYRCFMGRKSIDSYPHFEFK